jgi:hypothetical protein
MGVVFRATDLELLRPVAVKVLSETDAGGKQWGRGEKGNGNGKQLATLTGARERTSD